LRHSVYRFYKQLKAIVYVIVIGKIKCNSNLIVIEINVIDPCLMSIQEVYDCIKGYGFMTMRCVCM